MSFVRPISTLLTQRLREPPRHLQIVAGPRQVGKTTLVRQVVAERPAGSWTFIAADLPDVRRSVFGARGWLPAAWDEAEDDARRWRSSGHALAEKLAYVLVIDEVQTIEQWSSVVKGLWDRSRAQPDGMHVVLLGSAPLLVQKGLNESLTGRYELIAMQHWSFQEMNEAFGMTLPQYLYFGGYPGSAPFIADEERWRRYVLQSLIEPSIERDVLAMARVDTPALLRRLFELGCDYSAQILALDRVRRTFGEGHVLTLAHHLTLLTHAGLLAGLQKYAAQTVRQRGSPPKFQVLNNGLMTARGSQGFADAIADPSRWGRIVESAVGAHLLNTATPETKLHYWRDAGDEVDYVIEHRGNIAAVEVKSGPAPARHRGLDEFCRRHPDAKRWTVGGPVLPVGEFLMHPAAHWVK